MSQCSTLGPCWQPYPVSLHSLISLWVSLTHTTFKERKKTVEDGVITDEVDRGARIEKETAV